MAKEAQTSRDEMPDPIPESSRRNLRGYGVGASSVTARRGDFCPEVESMMEAVVERENMTMAYNRVVGNRGSAGIDGMTVEDLKPYLQDNWPRIKEALLNGRYEPQPVLRVEIPKPEGRGARKLGIPTVVDRLIQQAVHQVLSPIFEEGFSEFSYGFITGRSVHQALLKAKEYIAGGKRWVVDLDIEKFFDEVNHDILMSKVARKVKDKRVLLLIRRYLQAGIMADGLVTQPTKGTPQGGPLSPVLSNILLDELDKELERRGHMFCRYADDCNVYVGSKRAGERVMESIKRFLRDQLRLQVNDAKSAVDRPWRRVFLGYTMTWHKKPRLKVAPPSVVRLKVKLKEVFRRGRRCNLQKFIEEPRPTLLGWINYFRLSEVKGLFEELDGWIRRKLRCIVWRQWKRAYTRAKNLMKRGLTESEAWKSATNGRGPWWNAGARHMHIAFPKRFFDQLGLVSLLDQILIFQCSS